MSTSSELKKVKQSPTALLRMLNKKLKIMHAWNEFKMKVHK